MIAALIDIAEKRPEEIAYTLTSIYLPVLTYETEYGSKHQISEARSRGSLERFIRSERKFHNLDELRAQLESDEVECRK